MFEINKLMVCRAKWTIAEETVEVLKEATGGDNFKIEKPASKNSDTDSISDS